MNTLLLAATEAALLHGIIHLLIVLLIVAIVYYIGLAIARAFKAEPPIPSLWLGICALIALYFVIMFLLTLVP